MNAGARRTSMLTLTLFLAMSAGEAAALPPSHEAMSPTLGPDPGHGPVAKENVWSRGVSEENKRAAEVLFREGNALLKDSICVSAAAKYREALERWDHPNIHYNLAMALMNLDQPIELHGHLTKAIQYGPFPLEKDRFEHAKNYLALLERQVARVKVRCAVKGATVEMDGRPLFVPPGEYEGLVVAGRHTIVARGEGLVPNHSVRTLEGGKATTIDLDLKTMDELTGYRRRWPGWLPWAMVGTGAAVVAAGGGLHYTAIRKVEVADRDSKAQCPAPGGCPSEPSQIASARGRAETMQKLAVLAYAVGGVTLTAGGVLAYLNRAEPYVKTYGTDEPRDPPKKTALEIVPLLDPDRLGLVAAVRF